MGVGERREAGRRDGVGGRRARRSGALGRGVQGGQRRRWSCPGLGAAARGGRFARPPLRPPRRPERPPRPVPGYRGARIRLASAERDRSRLEGSPGGAAVAARIQAGPQSPCEALAGVGMRVFDRLTTKGEPSGNLARFQGPHGDRRLLCALEGLLALPDHDSETGATSEREGLPATHLGCPLRRVLGCAAPSDLGVRGDCTVLVSETDTLLFGLV